MRLETFVFGSQAVIAMQGMAGDPWLCVPGFHRVCLFDPINCYLSRRRNGSQYFFVLLKYYKQICKVEKLTCRILDIRGWFNQGWNNMVIWKTRIPACFIEQEQCIQRSLDQIRFQTGWNWKADGTMICLSGYKRKYIALTPGYSILRNAWFLDG